MFANLSQRVTTATKHTKNTKHTYMPTFVGFDMPHFVVSYNEKFYDFSKSWIEKIRKRSILISSEGYQFRELFFLKLNKDFEDFKERVDKLVNVYYN